MVINQLLDARRAGDFGRVFGCGMIVWNVMGHLGKGAALAGILVQQIHHGRAERFMEEQIHALGLFQ